MEPFALEECEDDDVGSELSELVRSLAAVAGLGRDCFSFIRDADGVLLSKIMFPVAKAGQGLRIFEKEEEGNEVKGAGLVDHNKEHRTRFDFSSGAASVR